VVIITESKASAFCVCCAKSMLVAHSDKASTNFFIDCCFFGQGRNITLINKLGKNKV